MQESNNTAQETANSSGFSQQPMTISAYKEVIDRLSLMLISENWGNLQSNSAMLETVESVLRDTIKNLEMLERKGKKGNMDIASVLGAVRKAHIALTKASVLLRKGNIKYPDYIDSCRDYLNLAANLMNF